MEVMIEVALRSSPGEGSPHVHGDWWSYSGQRLTTPPLETEELPAQLCHQSMLMLKLMLMPPCCPVLQVSSSSFLVIICNVLASNLCRSD